MKKENKKTLITLALIIVIAVALISSIRSCTVGSKDLIPSDSVLKASNEHLYYNNSSNDIYRMSIETNESELFVNDYILLDVTGNEILVKNGNDVLVLDANSGEIVFEAKDFDVVEAAVTEEYIYFKNKDGILNRMIRETGECSVIPMMENISVKKFDIYDKADIFFTSEADRVIRYNLNTSQITSYAEEIDVVDFTVNDGYLLYIDSTDNNSIYAIDLETSEAVRFKDIEALRLEYKKEFIFYFDKADGNKAKYKIKTLDSKLSKR